MKCALGTDPYSGEYFGRFTYHGHIDTCSQHDSTNSHTFISPEENRDFKFSSTCIAVYSRKILYVQKISLAMKV